jgi:NAD(P)-dependent dehydrogenase (short-subunit alcohol dehydrogenase family)
VSDQRVAWIAGGAQGIGLAVALGLAERGWAVAINDIDEPKLSAAAMQLSALAITSCAGATSATARPACAPGRTRCAPRGSSQPRWSTPS